MAAQNLTALSPSEFPQRTPPVVWPDSVQLDQAAIEQARRELGPDADPKDVLARAQQIRSEVGRD